MKVTTKYFIITALFMVLMTVSIAVGYDFGRKESKAECDKKVIVLENFLDSVAHGHVISTSVSHFAALTPSPKDGPSWKKKQNNMFPLFKKFSLFRPAQVVTANSVEYKPACTCGTCYQSIGCPAYDEGTCIWNPDNDPYGLKDRHWVDGCFVKKIPANAPQTTQEEKI